MGFLENNVLLPQSWKFPLEQWFSKCGPQTSSLHVTWELVRNVDSQAPDPLSRKLWGEARPSVFQAAL